MPETVPAVPEVEREFDHPEFGPMLALPDIAPHGPIFLTAGGHRAWLRAGRPPIVTPP